MGLDNGLQPIASPDGEVHLIVNGEFYGFEEIRADLQKSGCEFTTSSDSEIALHLYQIYGTAGFQKLRGEFAIVLYDARERLLFAVRDRVGVKPLFYAEHNGTFYVGSEIKAILAAGVPATWDAEAYATRSFYLSDHTLFSGIHSVQPGHMLVVNDTRVSQIRYWDFEFPDRSTLCERANTQSEPEIIQGVHDVIMEAIDARLKADVPIAFYLSGGIDSSAMLGAATHLSGSPFPAFHLSFGEKEEFDEFKFAKEAADFNGADFRPIQIRQSDLADNFERALWHNETPFFNAHGVAKFILSRHVRDAGFKAVVTGEGADEVFAGYPHFVRDMILYNSEGQPASEIEEQRQKIWKFAASQASGISADVKWLNRQLQHGVSWIENQASWFADLQTLYANSMRTTFGHVQPYRQLYNRLDHSRLDNLDPVNRSMYLWAKTFLPNFVLTTLGDRMEMAHSIEGRVPLLDHRVIEQAAQLPITYKVRGTREKYALREAMKPYLPTSLYNRKKHYFRAPPATQFKNGRLYQLVRDTLTLSALSDIPFFEPRKVTALLDELPSKAPRDQARLDPMVMELVSLCMMRQAFGLSFDTNEEARAA
ncbi:asparagine synthase (glutamine-hydrolyzing) [Roseibium sp. RKSG952]|nr:asparagine synthase (glutamine-hydrolyzing) [Roseibium sp. RKSG952]